MTNCDCKGSRVTLFRQPGKGSQGLWQAQIVVHKWLHILYAESFQLFWNDIWLLNLIKNIYLRICKLNNLFIFWEIFYSIYWLNFNSNDDYNWFNQYLSNLSRDFEFDYKTKKPKILFWYRYPILILRYCAFKLVHVWINLYFERHK